MNFKNIYMVGLLTITLFSCDKTQTIQSTEVEVKSLETKLELTDDQLKMIDPVLVQLEKRLMSTEVKANGLVQLPVDGRVWVSVPISGMLQTINVSLNQNVRKGELLATYSDQLLIDWQGEYLQSENELVKLTKELRRQESLLSNEATSEKALESVKSEHEKMRFKVETLKMKLQTVGLDASSIKQSGIVSKIELRAPISGQVSFVGASPGQFVSQTDRLFELVEASSSFVLLRVFESDVQKIRKDQEVVVNGVRKWTGLVQSVGSVLKEDRTIDVVVSINGDRTELIGGMFVSAVVKSENSETWVLPTESIVEYEGENFIFISASPNSFEIQKVEVGSVVDEYSEIVQLDYSLLKTQNIVSKGAYQLLMALKNKEE